MLRLILFACHIALAFFFQSASAATLHVEMTPELAGETGVTMKPLDKDSTRFIIRISTKNAPEATASRFPFVRRDSLEVRGEHGRVLRCNVHPRTHGHELLYAFDLDNEHAKCSCFVLAEHFDDGQVGGGSIFSYRLIDFIDPD